MNALASRPAQIGAVVFAALAVQPLLLGLSMTWYLWVLLGAAGALLLVVAAASLRASAGAGDREEHSPPDTIGFWARHWRWLLPLLIAACLLLSGLLLLPSLLR